MDADHHRSVITFAGEPEGVLEASVRGCCSCSRVDRPDYPRRRTPSNWCAGRAALCSDQGCNDVGLWSQFIRRAGERIARTVRPPIYMNMPQQGRRIDLANIRKGQFEGLGDIKSDEPEPSPGISSSSYCWRHSHRCTFTAHRLQHQSGNIRSFHREEDSQGYPRQG